LARFGALAVTSKQRQRRGLLLIAIATLEVSGCSPFDDLQPQRPDAAADDAAASSPRADREPPAPRDRGESGCPLATPPARPRFIGELGALDFSVAIRTLDFGDTGDGEGPKYRRIGFDLDGTCTGQGDVEASCVAPPWASADRADGVEGRDNAVGELFHRTAQVGGGSPTRQVNSTTAVGMATTAIRVRGYNGESTDDEVEVAVYAVTMHPNPGELTLPPVAPEWDGLDEWRAFDPWVGAAEQPDGTLAQSVDVPKYYDARAYVTEGLLVARFPKLRVAIGTMADVIMTARPELAEEDAWSLRDGTFAGRIEIDALLGTLDVTRTDAADQPLCTDHVDYVQAKQRICAFADIRYSGDDDRSLRCDAASWGWSFDAAPMKLVGVIRLPWLMRPCSAATAPSNDSCDSLSAAFGADRGP
jgi:hypothetical protein